MTNRAHCLITEIRLSGFRAYLNPVAFNFKKQKCLALFAPNGHGKSSLIDALEFLFSIEGTLDKLGVRRANNFAGPDALAHNLAADSQVDPFVEISFSKGTPPLNGKRAACGAKRPRPAIVDEVVGTFVVVPIVRGHALRSFVEQETPESRYESVAGWLKLGPLVNAQRSLRSLRIKIKAAAEDQSTFTAIDKKMAKATGGALQAWDVAALVGFMSGLISRVDAGLIPKSISAADPAYVLVAQRAKAESQRVGLAGLQQLRQGAAALFEELVDATSGRPESRGLLVDWPLSVALQRQAEEAERTERAATADAVFAKLWDAAEPLFAGESGAPETCPICLTPIAESTAGSAAEVRDHISRHRDALKNYEASKKKVGEATKVAAGARLNLVAAMKSLGPLLTADQGDMSASLVAYLKEVETWNAGELPASERLAAAVSSLVSTMDAKIEEIVRTQGAQSYATVKAMCDGLIELSNEREAAVRMQAQLETLATELNSQSGFISNLIRDKVQDLLDLLRGTVNDIYAQIHGQDAVSIRVELPPEEDVNQQRLNLLVDFAKNREGVQPSGYLSDSQVHSLALALRLAAIKRFNVAAPVIALDDVVTSYDADHRRAIAAMLAKEFSEHQVIIATHDERFFIYLKDQLPATDWQFKRIYRLDRDYGPRFMDHKVSDEMIDKRWVDGESAANEMRQAEEEWLLSICRGLGGSVKIRGAERAHSYERSELAASLGSVLKELGMNPPMVPGVSNRFLASLQQGAVENFGSHFQDGPYGDGSSGDEKTRWAEFTFFRSQFACPKCGKTRFKRPLGVSRPLCAAERCEAQFVFPQLP